MIRNNFQNEYYLDCGEAIRWPINKIMMPAVDELAKLSYLELRDPSCYDPWLRIGFVDENL